MKDFAILLGHYSLLLGLMTAGWSVAGALLGIAGKGRGLQRSAERALIVSSAATSVAALCLIYGFIANDFRLDYVYHYSSVSQSLEYKIGALWGGQAGSLLLWVLMLGHMGVMMVWTNRTKNRALMPWATAIVGVVMLFFMYLVSFVESPFAISAMRPDGVGLNPQLKNYWMMIHPPMLYTGYVAFTIPFAFAISALLTRRTGDIWFRTTRRWTIFAWFTLGTGILLGSYWAYIELGWGGYWAWDPVENASLMPWLTGTAFLHSVMIQERKNMLRVWNVLLIILTFSLCIFGTFLTRSGIISSVHSFATSGIGPAFGAFLFVIFFFAIGLLIWRLPDLKSEGRLESVVSRESTFLFNNLILVGIAATVLLLTTFPILSEAVTGSKVTMGPPIFNLVNIPWALVLLFLMGVGPLIAWRKASRSNLKRNFLWPGLAGFWVFLLMIVLDLGAFGEALRRMGRAVMHFDVAGVLDDVKAFYPAITFGLGAFVLGTMIVEYYRGLRVRVVHNHQNPVAAGGSLVWRNKRRWGGYIVHAGVVLVFFGIAASSAYQKETTKVLVPDQYVEADRYMMRYDGYRLEAVDDHLGIVTELTVFNKKTGKSLGSLQAEQRYHPNMMIPEMRDAFLTAKQICASRDEETCERAVSSIYALMPRLEQKYRREVKTPSTEVGILSSINPLNASFFGEDFYVIPLYVDPASGQANFRIFINPMVNFLWFGGLIFVLGSLVCIMPDARERKRLDAALAIEERAVA